MPDADNSVVKTVKLTKIFRDFWLRAKVTAVSELDLDIMPGIGTVCYIICTFQRSNAGVFNAILFVFGK